MPKVNMATTEQVAEFFKVPVETIRSVYHRSHDELDADGSVVKHAKEMGKVFSCNFSRCDGKNGYLVGTMDNGETLEIPTRGVRLFPKRAVLRIVLGHSYMVFT